MDDVKSNLRQAFLGKGGIHGIGYSRALNQVRVYVGPSPHAEEAAVMEELQRAAIGVDVRLIREESPSVR